MPPPGIWMVERPDSEGLHWSLSHCERSAAISKHRKPSSEIATSLRFHRCSSRWQERWGRGPQAPMYTRVPVAIPSPCHPERSEGSVKHYRTG